ncbi:MAG: radical SAM protein [Proteobacteria bacterium]|nr:radical SAM protein [Pseudomonadota bacterium]
MLDGSPRGPALALVSLYDIENNAIRQLAAGVRATGRRVVEIYFKDWKNNHLEDPTDYELSQLLDILRDEGVGLVGVSLRASAYERVAGMVTARIRQAGLPVVLGGWHVTVRPERVMGICDAMVLGEADASFPELVSAYFEGRPTRAIKGIAWEEDGKLHKNPLPALIEDLDVIPWRDYDSPDKWVLSRGDIHRGDPMADDPLYQVLCSHGCVQKCSFCHNSFDTGAEGSRLRFRSVDSVLAELEERRRVNPHIRRVRFDDEIFGLSRAWLREFAERYPVEVGLPFDILTEPTVVNDEYVELVKKAGARVVHMGIQSNENVNREQLERRADRKTTRRAVRLLSEAGLFIRYLCMVDVPNTTPEDQESLFRFLAEVPRPYDLYLFSLTWFPGSKMVEDMIESGALHESQVEGAATKTFSQYRVDLGWPRANDDLWWLALVVLLSSQTVPSSIVTKIMERRMLYDRPRPLVIAADVATLAKTVRVAARMVREGELTGTLIRRWWNPQQMITM